MTDEDAAALAVYLKSIAAIRNKVPGPVGATEKPLAPYLAVMMPN